MSANMTYGLVFLSTLFVDYAWTRYIADAAAKRAHRAGLWNIVIIGLGAFNVVTYTADKWALLPAIVGAYLGTVIAVKRGTP